MALSRAICQQVRRRIAVAPNDNSSVKTSRFKVQTPSAQFLEYAIACIHPLLPLFVNQLRHEITMTQPKSTLPLLNDPLPLPTMLITTPLLPLPPSSSTPPLTLSLPHITRHRMSESTGLEAQHFLLQLDCAQSIYRQWPSGATVARLSRVCCDIIVRATCGQHAP